MKTTTDKLTEGRLTFLGDGIISAYFDEIYIGDLEEDGDGVCVDYADEEFAFEAHDCGMADFSADNAGDMIYHLHNFYNEEIKELGEEKFMEWIHKLSKAQKAYKEKHGKKYFATLTEALNYRENKS